MAGFGTAYEQGVEPEVRQFLRDHDRLLEHISVERPCLLSALPLCRQGLHHAEILPYDSQRPCAVLVIPDGREAQVWCQAVRE